MVADARVALAAWEHALIDVLLPAGDADGRAVLLACDTEALHAAARRVGVPERGAVDAFIAAVKAQHAVSTSRGLQRAAAAVRPFSRAATPRAAPPFLGALCVTVLAASRMDRDERLSTRAYYARLCALLVIEPLDTWPAVAGFRTLVSDGFAALADWMARDEAGVRGVLLIPEQPKPKLVGLPISQTLLRGRDRTLLSAFFAAHERHLRAGYDPVLLLRRWGGRERLTQPAQQVLGDIALRDLLSAAVRSALGAWDGSIVDDSGRRVWSGRLRLSVRPGRLALRVAIDGLTRDVDARGPADEPIALRAAPLETPLALSLLAHAAAGRVRLIVDDDEAVSAIPGPTVLFEIAAGGLEQVSAAGGTPVWVLTCEPDVLRSARGVTPISAAGLPCGWQLLPDVDAQLLPERLRVSAADDSTVRGATLAGGLALGGGAWLVDHPPHVVCDVPEPADVEIDGAQRGYLDPGERLDLSELAGRHGAHRVQIGGLYELEFELREQGLREQLGSLRHHPQDRRLLRAGVVDAQRHGLTSDGASVSGALITGDSPPPWTPPMLVRFNATVYVIYRDGSTRPCSPPEPPVWLRQVGLAHAVDQWEIPDAADAVWLCVDSDPHPRVLAVADDDVPSTPHVLALADRYADEPVIDLSDGSAQRRWAALVDEARADEELSVAD